MINFTNGKCRGTKPDGSPCRMPADECGYCPHHDPSPEARLARVNRARTAGKASVRARHEQREQALALARITLRSPEDATALLEQAVNELREGLIDPAKTRIQIQAATAYFKHVLFRELEERVAALEELGREYGLHLAEGWKRIMAMFEYKGTKILRERE